MFNHQSRSRNLDRGFSITDFTPLTQKLGTGAQGEAYRATFVGTGHGGPGPHLITGTSVCLKKFTNGVSARREIAAMDGLTPHPNVVGCLGTFEDPWNYYLVLELCGFDLSEVPCAAPGDRYFRTMPQRLVMLKGIAKGLAHLHDENVIHCDLKLENVLIGEDGRAKLCDLGLAQPARGPKATICIGTPYYLAPELFTPSVGYDERFSTWQLGLVMTFVAWSTLLNPFSVSPAWAYREILAFDYKLPDRDMRGYGMTVPEDAAIRDILIDLIFVPAEKRLRVSELLRLPFFGGIPDD